MHNKTHEICNEDDDNTDSWAMLYKVYDDHEYMEWIFIMAKNQFLVNYACCAATFNSSFNWLDISEQLPDGVVITLLPKLVQWVGGFGRSSGEGGSLNLGPA